MKFLLLFLFCISAYSQQIKFTQITDQQWDSLPDNDKKYYWNKAISLQKSGLNAIYNRYKGFENDKTKVPGASAEIKAKPGTLEYYSDWKYNNGTTSIVNGVKYEIRTYSKKVGDSYFVHILTIENGKITDIETGSNL